MHLFIDTNILLSFYHFTSDDLEELRKLIVLAVDKKISLLLTSQVVDEFSRNRENKIADAIRRFRDQQVNLAFPQLCKDYDEYEKLRRLQKQYEQEHASLLKKIVEDAQKRELKADKVIGELLKISTCLKSDGEIIQRARMRIEVGNPPGKRDSIGDAINWEALLAGAEDGSDLFFITDDKDYCSPLSGDSFNKYLLSEWERKKKSKLVYYKRLSDLTMQRFPHIKLANEYEKEILIQRLGASPDFTATHVIISKLRRHADFTAAQLNAIVEAALQNNQVNWIIRDPDVKQFLASVINGRENEITTADLKVLKLLLEPPSAPEDEDYDLPF